MDHPPKPPKAERQERILAELRGTPSLRVAELAASLGVSTETIRRDLDELTTRGLLNRTYGGAIRPAAQEPALAERHQMLTAERTAIARAVSALVRPGQVLAIGSGATTVHVARRLAAEQRDLTVITHAFGIATVLAHNPTITILFCPGHYNGREGSTYGAHTVRFLNEFRVDHTILGATGLTEEGASDANADSAAVYQAMIARAANTIIAADHTKFGRAALALYAGWEQVSHCVTDRAPDGALAASIRRYGVELLVA